MWDRVTNLRGDRQGTIVAIVDFGDEDGARIRWDDLDQTYQVRVGELRPDMFVVAFRYAFGMVVRCSQRSEPNHGVVEAVDQNKGILVDYGGGSGSWEMPWDLVHI